MAVRFDALTDAYSSNTGLPASNIATVTLWMYISVDRADFTSPFNMYGQNTPDDGQYTLIDICTTGTGTALTARSADGLTELGAFSVTTGTWYAIAVVANGSTTTFYHGTDPSSLTSDSGSLTLRAAPTTLQIGRNVWSNWLNGRVAAVKLWDAALTAAEVAAELAQFDPVRTSNLLHYHKLKVDETTDYSGNGNTLTAGSTATAVEGDPPIPDVAGVQPTYVADRGTTANATAGTTSSVSLTSPTSIAVGNYLLARVAVDNSGTSGAAPGCTVTDARNTWTVLGPALADPGAANAGSTAYLCYATVVTAYQAADTLTFNWGGISTTAKAIVVEEWDNIDLFAPVAVSAVTNDSGAAASTTAVSAAITPTAAYQLVYTCLADEGIAGDSITYDSDTTNGSWSAALTRVASANATATNNQCVAGQYKVVSTGGAQTWNATITSRDWAAIAVVFSPTQIQPRPDVVNSAALIRAANW